MDTKKQFDFGECLRDLRTEKGWYQQDLAKLLNTSQDTISLWERGKSLPDFMSFRKLAQIFQVSADYLLGLTEY